MDERLYLTPVSPDTSSRVLAAVQHCLPSISFRIFSASSLVILGGLPDLGRFRSPSTSAFAKRLNHLLPQEVTFPRERAALVILTSSNLTLMFSINLSLTLGSFSSLYSCNSSSLFIQ